MSDGSQTGPEQQGGEKDQAEVGGGSFVVAGGDGAELLEAADAALDDIAPHVDAGVEAGRAAGPMGAPLPVVGALGQGVRQLAGAQPAPVAGVAVAAVG